MNKLLLLAAFALALALPASAADAAKAKKKPEPAPALSPEDLFKKLDVNQNGKVGQDEFYAQFTPAPTKKDKNPKATKTRAESDELFAQLDANKDKVLTLEEFKSGNPSTNSDTAKKKEKKKAK